MNFSSPRVTVVIPNWNGRDWLPGCMEGLAAQKAVQFRVLLVDNGSTDGSVEFVVGHYPEVEILALGRNTGFAAAVNAGIRHAQTKYVALLNTDTVPQPGWLSRLVERMDELPSHVGSLASRMVSMDDPNMIDNAGDILTRHGAARKRGYHQDADGFAREAEVFSACAGAALYRRSFLDAVGGFDETFFAYLEDVDLGLRGRMRAYRSMYVPGAVVWHKGHGAGTRHGAYVRMITRNRLLLVAGNLPGPVIRKNLRHLLYGQFYFFLAYRRPLHSIAGLIDFLRVLPRTREQRKRNLEAMKLSWQEVDALLDPDMGEPKILRAIADRIRGRRR